MTKVDANNCYAPCARWPEDDRNDWIKSTTRPICAVEATTKMQRLKSRSVLNYSRGATDARCEAVALGYDPDRLHAALFIEPVVRELVGYWEARGYKPATMRHRLQGIERVMAGVTPKADRSYLLRIMNDIPRLTDREAKRQRMQDSRALLDCGFAYMRIANAKRLTSRSAVMARTGLQLALLSLRPYRLGDFVDMVLRDDDPVRNFRPLYLISDGGRWEIRNGLREKTTKRRPANQPLPESLVEPLEWYLNGPRKFLCDITGYDGPRLWVSSRAPGLLQNAGVYKRIVAYTERVFGVSVNPHLFRDCLVTTVKRVNPAAQPEVNRMLGNGPIQEARHYDDRARAEAVVAASSILDYCGD